MENEEKTIETMEPDYIQAIQDLKENSVSKDEYLKLKEENKKLLNAVVTNTPIETEPVAAFDPSEVRNKIFRENSGVKGVEWATDILDLRDYELQNGKGDPFINQLDRQNPSFDQMADAQQFADVLQYCLDQANGDDAAFQSAFQSCLIDRPFSRR